MESQWAIVTLSFFDHYAAIAFKEGMNEHVFNFNLIFSFKFN